MATEAKTIGPETPCCEVHREGLSLPEDGALSGAANVFKALSDETRLRIVRAMASSPHALCECNIVPFLGLSQSTVSYHLKVLREAGLVEFEKRGLWTYYRLDRRALLVAIRALTEAA